MREPYRYNMPNLEKTVQCPDCGQMAKTWVECTPVNLTIVHYANFDCCDTFPAIETIHIDELNDDQLEELGIQKRTLEV